MHKCRAAMARRVRRGRAVAALPPPQQQQLASVALATGAPSLSAVVELSEATRHMARAAARAATPAARAELFARLATAARAAAAAAEQLHDAQLLQRADCVFRLRKESQEDPDLNSSGLNCSAPSAASPAGAVSLAAGTAAAAPPPLTRGDDELLLGQARAWHAHSMHIA